MALIERKEFAARCGMTQGNLSNYIQRGKVILEDNGLVDDQHPDNVLFASKRVGKTSKLKPMKTAKGKKGKFTPNTDRDKKLGERMKLESLKKTTEVERMQHEIALKELQFAKMSGKVIPTELVKRLFAQHFKSMTMAFKQAADLLLVEFGKKAKMNRNDIAEMKGALVTVINRAVEDGTKATGKTLASIVTEHSQQKNVA